MRLLCSCFIVVVCEHKVRRISCRKGLVLRIVSAVYGRLSNRYCGRGKNTNCSARRSTSILRRSCNGKRTCLLKAKNSVYGDPCAGTLKYLSVRYRCASMCWFSICCAIVYDWFIVLWCTWSSSVFTQFYLLLGTTTNVPKRKFVTPILVLLNICGVVF